MPTATTSVAAPVVVPAAERTNPSTMAANAPGGGRGAGGAGGGNNNGPMNTEHVEFSVKAEEDLYLVGSETTIRRVTAETNYSCLMLKTQRFSSLFRHYAKYHGLRKDDLEYYFVNLLENEDTPESVQLQRSDTIMVRSYHWSVDSYMFYPLCVLFLILTSIYTLQVRKRRKPEPPEAAADDDNFFLDMRELLNDDEHMDAVFLVHASSPGEIRSSATPMDTVLNPERVDATSPLDSPMAMENPNLISIRAHKAVLTARTEYFKALFRTNAATSQSGGADVVSNTTPTVAFQESQHCTIHVDPMFTESHIRAVLEFIYTNRILELRTMATDDVLSILHLSDQWLLRDLKRACEHELIRAHLTVSTVARLYGATEDFHAKRLSKACIDFIMSNLRQVTGNAGFLEEMQHFPHLMLPVLKAAADIIPEGVGGGGPLHKKQRTVEPHGTPITSAVAAYRSSPVPDSDT
jgi:speckle-type POZ protein